MTQRVLYHDTFLNKVTELDAFRQDGGWADSNDGVMLKENGRTLFVTVKPKPMEGRDMLFNINDVVRVKLTERGRKVLADDHRVFWESAGLLAPDYHPPKEDEDGWSTWQLWALMTAFGEHTGIGRLPCFDTNINIPQMAHLVGFEGGT